MDVLQSNQWNMILQVLILLLFAAAIILKFKGTLRQHGLVMASAFVLNIVSMLFFMLPLLLNALPFMSKYPDQYSTIVLAHHFLGTIAFILSLFLVVRFAYARFGTERCKGVWLMRITAITWGVTLVLGIYLYLVGYFPG